MTKSQALDFSLTQLLHASPVLVIALGIVIVMLLTGWRRSDSIAYYATQSVLLVAILCAIVFFPDASVNLTLLAKLDRPTATIFVMICTSSLMSVYIAKQYLKANIEAHEEFYILMLLVILGASTLVLANHFASLFLGFELMSIALVGLIGYMKQKAFSIEASFKYLILSAAASSFMLLGIALLYAYSGSLSFDSVASDIQVVSTDSENLSPLILSLGCLLFFSGLAFKVSLIPFHFWTPDVYAGSPAPVTLILASISKLAIFSVLLKCCFSPLFYGYFLQPEVYSVFVGLALLSMVLGNLLALQQTQIKRILAYSSIAHMGYLMVLVFVVSKNGMSLAWQTTIYYFAAYLLASVSIFYVISIITISKESEDVEIDDLKGLFWHSPRNACLLVIALLSLAGIPLTAGFIGKFYLLSFASYHALWLLLSAIIVGSAVGLAYYLPLIFALFDRQEVARYHWPTSLSSSVLVVSLIVGSLYLGILPGSFSAFLAWL